MNILLSPCAPENLVYNSETGSADPSGVSLLILHTYSVRVNLMPTHEIPPPIPAAASIYSAISGTYAIRSVSSSSGHALAYRWYSLPRVRRQRASSPQGSSSKLHGCCHFAGHHGPINVLLFFPSPTIGMMWAG